jgi:DNA modification methylase
MTEGIGEWANDIHVGDAGETMRDLPASSVHAVVTSPPYFGLRDYGVDGQIGLEDSLNQYIQTLVDVGEAVRHVLRPDGSWWLNLGDSYSGSNSTASATEGRDDLHTSGAVPDNSNTSDTFLGRKNKMLVPHRVAIALQDAGWVVRNDVTWVKPNPMPSSVKDRLNTTTEQIFHLTPAPDYWYDLDAIREPYAESYERRAEAGYEHKHGDAADGWGEGDHNHAANHNRGGILAEEGEYGDHMNPNGKNPGDVFEVTTKPYPEAHFAVYPPDLVRKPIKATCPPKVCAECGAPYDRVVDRETGEYDYSERREQVKGRIQSSGTMTERPSVEHVGWQKGCECDTDATEPGIVLDPFAGAGTTCLVAKRLGRQFVGIDLNPEYVAMAQKRVGVTVDDPERLLDDDETSLTAFADGGSIHHD